MTSMQILGVVRLVGALAIAAWLIWAWRHDHRKPPKDTRRES